MPRAVALIAAVVLLATVSGCSSTSSGLPDEPVARITTAKSASQSAEQVVARFIPQNLISSVRQTPTGSLFSYASGKRWFGNTTVRLVSAQDGPHLVDEISRKAAAKVFGVQRDTTPLGTPRATLIADSDVSILVGVWNDGTVVNIDSFSMCFSLPDGYSLGPSY